MQINYQSICGRLGRYIQLLRDARMALQEAYKAHKDQIAQYELCLAHANKQADICRMWALSAKREIKHWQDRALAADAENFTIKNNQ
jgi:hypothetical protein